MGLAQTVNVQQQVPQRGGGLLGGIGQFISQNPEISGGIAGGLLEGVFGGEYADVPLGVLTGMQTASQIAEGKRKRQVQAAKIAKAQRDEVRENIKLQLDAAGLELDKEKFNFSKLKAKDKKIKPQQFTDAMFAKRISQGNDIIEELESKGYDPTSFTGALGRFAPEALRSEDRKRYNQAKLNIITASLRKESGAAIGKDEYEKQDALLFPQRGDDEATIQQKADTRRILEQSLRASSGKAFDLFKAKPKSSRIKELQDKWGIKR